MTTPSDPINSPQPSFHEELKNLSKEDGIWNGYLVKSNNGLERINIFQFLGQKLLGHLPSRDELQSAVTSYLSTHQRDVRSKDIVLISNLVKNVGLTHCDQKEIKEYINILYWEVTPHDAECLKKEYAEKIEDEPTVLIPKQTQIVASENTEMKQELRDLFATLDTMVNEDSIPDIQAGYAYTRAQNPIKYTAEEISGETIVFFQDSKAFETNGREGFDLSFNLTKKTTTKNGKEVAISDEDLAIVRTIVEGSVQWVKLHEDSHVYEFFKLIKKLNKELEAPDKIFIVKDKEATASPQKDDGWAAKGIEMRFDPGKREILKNGKKIDFLEAREAELVKKSLDRAIEDKQRDVENSRANPLELVENSPRYEQTIDNILNKIDEQQIIDSRDGYYRRRNGNFPTDEFEGDVTYAIIKIASGDPVFSMKSKVGSTEKIHITINLKTKETRKNGNPAPLNQDDIDFILKNVDNTSVQIMHVIDPEIVEIFQKIMRLYEKTGSTEDDIYIVQDKAAHAASQHNKTDAEGWANEGTEIRFNLKTREIYKKSGVVKELSEDEIKLANENIDHVLKV